ncbi:MAG: LVIVD repeat-containing protein [Candidatus Dormibacteria bacterium]
MNRRLINLVQVTALASLVLLVTAAQGVAPYSGPSPQLPCDSQSLPETGAQGRVPKSEVDSGRAARGYTCNTALVGHQGNSGGFRVERYIDAAGHECAFYDSTLLFPTNLKNGAASEIGVYVLDMTDHAHPVFTTNLTTPAMDSPHESLRLNRKRGLLVADMGYPTFNPGFVDVYDVSKDCRNPVLDSSTPLGILGHESAFSPDGTVFYVSSTGGHTLAAVDLTNPSLPSVLWVTTAYSPHGMSVNDAGTRLYIADTGLPGLIILDVSGINAHHLNPAVPVVSRLTWPEVSIPQNAIPFSEKGHPYLAEVDEYTRGTGSSGGYTASASVGAARIIDIKDEVQPSVVSNMRLAVNQAAARAGTQQNDYGAQSPVQGYAGHYCNVPQEVDPNYIACSFIISGLRVFNIQDLKHPYQMAYFNAPSTAAAPAYVGINGGNFAMSSPTFDTSRNEIWYSDGFWGFYVVRLTSGAFSHATPLPANTGISTGPNLGANPGVVAAPLPNTAGDVSTSSIGLVGLLLIGCGLAIFGVRRRRLRAQGRPTPERALAEVPEPEPYQLL